MTVEWKGDLVFEAIPPSGDRFVMSGTSGVAGPSPLEAFIASGAACSGMDVVMILEKKRQQITSYRVEVEGVRTEEDVYPRPYISLTFRHIIEGVDLDPHAVEQAVALSDEKYCSVIATLRASPKVTSEIRIVQNASA